MNRIGRLEGIWRDLRHGARLLRLSPGFTVVAIVSLALGIGANTAIFQLLDAVRLRSLPMKNPQQLAELRIAGCDYCFGIVDNQYGTLTRPIWQQIREHREPFSGIFAWSSDDIRLGRGSESRHATGLRVSGDFFRVLGIQPWRGRLISPEDEAGACPSSKAVVSYQYWQAKMAARELHHGNELIVDGELKEVIGVTPPGFFGLAVGESFDIALPFCQPKELRRDVFDIVVMGRLRPGWTLKRASAQFAAISPGIFEATAPTGYSTTETETYKRFRLGAYPASRGVSSLRTAYNSSLWLLLGIAALVLLIACANLANLMLARATAREREIAVRSALGASRGRLLRQLLAESGLLAAIGATLGMALAQVLTRLLVWSLSTESASVNLPMDMDWRVLAFAAAVAASACIVFGALPALRATGIDPINAIKAGAHGIAGGRERFSIQRLMVVTQISVSLVLLVAALLFVRSFRNLLIFDPGMREKGITVADVGFDQAHLPASRYEEFKRNLLDEVRSIPGILNAATTTIEPLLGGGWTHKVHIGSTEGESKFTWVSPSYLETMGIPLLTGRGFNRNDTAASPRVALVNQAFVRHFLGGVNPLGQSMRTDPEPSYPSTVYQIVGVIPDTQYNDLRSKTPPMAFAPASQFPAKEAWVGIMIRSDAPPAIVMSTVKHRLAEKHPEIIVEVSNFQASIRDQLVGDRLLAILAGSFGLLAALLATVGLYGMTSYTVTCRRNEIGIRIALGAGRAQVVNMIMREAAWLLVIGIATGTLVSLLAGRAAAALLFKLNAYDPVTLIAAAALLVIVAAFASFLPARRASKLDPIAALRCE